jgi:hypothetical protein
MRAGDLADLALGAGVEVEAEDAGPAQDEARPAFAGSGQALRALISGSWVSWRRRPVSISAR